MESASVQNWDGLYAYAYPPTSLIRVCLNKVITETVEIILIAPGWPNQEWRPTRSRDRFSNNSPTSAEPAQADLLTPLSSASTESQPSRLEVIKGSTRREDFLKWLPKVSLYLRDNPQRGLTNLSGRCSESGTMLSKLILSRQLSSSSCLRRRN